MAVATARRRRLPSTYRAGTTVVTVNWNSLDYLRVMLNAVRAFSPPDVEIIVVDNGSSDGSLEYLQNRDDVHTIRLPLNVGHGIALDIAMPGVNTEYVAVLDVDAFPISDRWLSDSHAALESGSLIAGAQVHRNYIHPCFLVTRTSMIHEMGLTFRHTGRMRRRGRRSALFLDVAEGLSQRVIIYGGGTSKLHRFEVTSARGPGTAGAVFGDVVYHNQGATWGPERAEAPEHWRIAVRELLGWELPGPSGGEASDTAGQRRAMSRSHRRA